MSGYYCGECGNGFREAEGYHRTSCSKKTEAETLRAENTRLLSTLESCRAELAGAKADALDWQNRASGYSDMADRARKAEAALAEARTHKEVWSNQFKKVCDDRDEARRELADSLAREKLTEGERDEARAALAERDKSYYERCDRVAELVAENARLATLNGQEVVRLTAEVEKMRIMLSRVRQWIDCLDPKEVRVPLSIDEGIDAALPAPTTPTKESV